MPEHQVSIFVGMDVHKNSINVAVFSARGKKPTEEWQLANQPRAVKRLIKKLKRMARDGEVTAAYEAGPCGYALQRQMRKEEIDCIVVAPSLVPYKRGERIKTDRRDARKLGEMLRSEMLTEVFPPTPQEEAVRDLTRAREDAKQDQMKARNRLGKMLLRHGFEYSKGNWTKGHQAWLRTVRMEDKNSQRVFEGYLFALEQVEERLKILDAYIEEVSQSDQYREKVGWLRCLRGIDTLTAMVILAELHGFGRFASPRELMSYLGLTPSEHTSSNRVRRGSITKAGNSHVRRVLVEAAWNYRHRPSVSAYMRRRREGQPPAVLAIADRAQERLHKRYFKLKEVYNKPHNVVTVAIARELVGFVWAILQQPTAA